MRARVERVREKWYALADEAESWEERYWDLERLYDRTYPVLGPPTYQQHRAAESMAELGRLVKEVYVESVTATFKADVPRVLRKVGG
jgi:hypothetical protein